MKKVVQILNEMKARHVFDLYAIGGAMAATYYVEPFQTEDIDVMFCPVASEQNSLLLLASVYKFLGEKGFEYEREMVLMYGYPVQFIPVYSPLVEEAVKEANTILVEGEPLHVMSPEHLTAIMLATGRAKDYARIALFLESHAIALPKLMRILEHHNLSQKWNDNQYRFQS
jgi:hypothetical protein